MAIEFCKECGKLKLQCNCNSNNTSGELFCSEEKKAVKKGQGVFSQPKTEAYHYVCPKCGSVESDALDMGAPYSDESNILLFKCRSCGYVERQGDGGSNK